MMPSNKKTMVKNLGSEEAYKKYMSKLGAKGGSRKVPKGKYYKGK